MAFIEYVRRFMFVLTDQSYQLSYNISKKNIQYSVICHIPDEFFVLMIVPACFDI